MDFHSIPVSEMDSSAQVIEQLGYRLVVFGFEGTLLPDKPDREAPWVIERYTPEHRDAFIQKACDGLVDLSVKLLVALLIKGVALFIVTLKTEKNNGEVEDKNGGYIFQGQTFVKQVLERHIGVGLMDHITTMETLDVMNRLHFLTKHFHLKPYQILLIHDHPGLIQKARVAGFGGMMVD